MILYYDRHNVLKEVINDDAIVESSTRNNIYIYYEKVDEENFDAASIRVRSTELLDSEEQLVVLTPTTKEIPYSKDRDLKYFKDYKTYKMYGGVLPTNIDGAMWGGVVFTKGTQVEALTHFTYFVNENNVIAGRTVSESDYVYLLSRIGSMVTEDRLGEVLRYYFTIEEVMEYVAREGGKIDIIKVRGVVQTIVNKTVELDVATRQEIVDILTRLVSVDADIDTLKGRALEHENDINTIKSKIPTEASSTNQLADKDYVDNEIQKNGAHKVSKQNGNNYEDYQDLISQDAYYVAGAIHTLDPNDYAIVNDYNDQPARFSWNVVWTFDYYLNELSVEQQKALNSGVSAAWKEDVDEALDRIYEAEESITIDGVVIPKLTDTQLVNALNDLNNGFVVIVSYGDTQLQATSCKIENGNDVLYCLYGRTHFVRYELDAEVQISVYPIGANAKNSLVVIADALTNINGRVLTSYEANSTTISGYDAISITYGGVKLTKERALAYLNYMGANTTTLPVYNYENPDNIFFVDKDKNIWKPQYSEASGLALYFSSKLGGNGGVLIDIGSASTIGVDSKVFPQITNEKATEIYNTFTSGVSVILKWTIFGSLPLEYQVLSTDNIGGNTFDIIVHNEYLCEYTISTGTYATLKVVKLGSAGSTVRVTALSLIQDMIADVNYLCSNPLTSLNVTFTKGASQNPLWEIKFKTGTSFTATFPNTMSWVNGTPSFEANTEYTIIVEECIEEGHYDAFVVEK